MDKVILLAVIGPFIVEFIRQGYLFARDLWRNEL